MSELVKNDNFVGLQGWMINDLHLKGNELIVFAIIHGFSQEGQGIFNGSLQYLADWTNSTKQGVIKNIRSLLEKDLITKKEIKKGSIKFCEYSSKFNGGKQSLMDDETKFNGTVKQSLPNNIVNNIDNTIEKDFETFYEKYPKHIAKQTAKRAYLSAIKNKKTTHEEIMNGLDKYIAKIKRDNTEYRFIKYPSSWLTGGCWDDEYDFPSKPQEKEMTDEEKLLELARKRKERKEKEELENQQMIERLRAQGNWIDLC